MNLKLINIGFGNVVSANRIISIVSPESAPIKRIITVARDENKLVMQHTVVGQGRLSLQIVTM